MIVDKEREKKAEWPIGRLEAWLDSVRDNEMLNTDNLFSCFDIEWEDLDNSLNETINNSSSSSRINLNISALRDTIMKAKILNPTQNMNQTISMDFKIDVNKHMSDIKQSVSNLKKMYKNYQSGSDSEISKSSQNFEESIKSIDHALRIIQSCFDERNTLHHPAMNQIL